MKKSLRWIILVILVIAAAIQFIPVNRTSLPVTGDITAPPEIKAMLKNACYDCHSHETIWPAYSHIAPVSWLVASDVQEGREKMNFSIWAAYKPIKQKVLLDDAVDQITEGEMPPFPYRLLHPSARLTDEQIRTLTAWMKSAAAE
jgi:hypothetical protein